MRATIADVARASGVSTATVSYVLNGTKNVLDATRQRVISAAESLNYHPNLTARSLKTGKKNLIGFLVPNILNISYSTLIENIEAVLSPKGYNLLIANTKESVAQEIKILDTLSANLVDGLIISSSCTDYREIADHIPESLPALFIDSSPKNCSRETIAITSYTAMCAAVGKLIDSNHRKIGYIAGLKHISTVTKPERLNAYRDTLIKHGIGFDEKFIVYMGSTPGSVDSHVEYLLSVGCTAIVVPNQMTTADVLAYCAINQINPVTDIPIIGFRNSSIRNSTPLYIPVIEQPMAEMGSFVGNEILTLIESDISAVPNCGKLFVSSFHDL